MISEETDQISIDGKPANIWTCPKCGLLRCSRETHKHNVPLSREILELFNGTPKRKEKVQLIGEKS